MRARQGTDSKENVMSENGDFQSYIDRGKFFGKPFPNA